MLAKSIIVLSIAGAAFFAETVLAYSESGSFKDTLGYEPSPAYPHGRPHPDAPKELQQFAFFIGEYDCIDRQRDAEGEWQEFPVIWNASYFLNGFAIQDKYYAPGFQTSNVRMYVPAEGLWKVSYFSAPQFFTGEWTGKKDGDAIVLTRTFPTSVSRLTFYEINDRSFEWKGERIVEGEEPVATWTSSCTRRGD